MKYFARLIPLLIVLSFLLVACGETTTGSGTTPTAAQTPTPVPTPLNVFAAASLKNVFTEIKSKFEQAHPGVTIKYNFAGSQALATQIINGAPVDVFASADQTNMQKVVTSGQISTSQVFAKNRLVVITPPNNPGGITSLKDLSKKGIKLDIAAASVPAGKYWLQVLDKLGKSADYGAAYETSVKGNVVSQEDNVESVVQKVGLGEVDAGVVYKTDAAANTKLNVIDIPDTYNVIAQYPIGTVSNAAHASVAQQFVQYVLSAEGQAILQKYSFITVS